MRAPLLRGTTPRGARAPRLGSRRGFTLVELLVAVVIAGIVLVGVMGVLFSNQRVFTQNREQVLAQQTVRAGIEVVAAELREVSPALGDILALSQTSVQVRALRGAGIICSIVGRSPLVMAVRNLGRPFAVSDPVTFFVANQDDEVDADYWATGTVSAAATGAACPAGQAAQSLTVGSLAPAVAADSVMVGGMMRAFEPFTYGSVAFGGETYLGRIDGAANTTPLVGPVDASGGIRFVYRDVDGNATTTPAAVRTIELTLRSSSSAQRDTGGFIADSLTTLIHLRN
jgi:prepilin-type N-terminal cleavage/methylation domain-containing protein